MLIKLSDNLTGRIFVSYIFSASRHKLYMVGVGCVLFVMYLISYMYLGVHNNMGRWNNMSQCDRFPKFYKHPGRLFWTDYI